MAIQVPGLSVLVRRRPSGRAALCVLSRGENQAQFYTLVSQDTVEQDFALKRQLFLCEQGYRYEIHEIEQMHQKKLA